MILNYKGFNVEIILLSVNGSRLYGNFTDKSDYDYRGVFIADKSTKLGLIGKIDQIEDPDFFKELNNKYKLNMKDFSDCICYELNRFATLAADANPNIFDILCTNENKCLYINDKGKELIDNRFLFLSSKLKFTFSGYAISQLTKIRNRDKYLTQYPDVSKVLDQIKTTYENKLIDWNWICNNFGGSVAEFVCAGESAQKNIKLPETIPWDSFKKYMEQSTDLHEYFDIDAYRIPQIIDYSNAKDLKGKRYNLEERYDVCEGQYMTYFLHNSASFRTFSPSMLAIYTEGNGIFTPEGKLKSSEPEHVGEFVCLLAIDQMKYKSDKDFNAAMWEWKCKRNETRSAMEAEFGIDLKNLSHLWRLMTKAKEILLTGDYKPELIGDDLKTLKGIRDGSLYGKESYDFAIKFAEENDKELDELYKTTKLQKKPDIKRINDLVLRLQNL